MGFHGFLANICGQCLLAQLLELLGREGTGSQLCSKVCREVVGTKSCTGLKPPKRSWNGRAGEADS